MKTRTTDRRLRAGVLALLSWASAVAQAQTATPAVPPKPAPPPVAAASPAASAPANEMPRVEVTGTADNGEGSRRQESIAKTIYGREELDRQGDIDVTDVLKRLPGVSMDNGAPRMRGLGGGYTQVLINGEPAPPGFAIDTLAPSDVERIEVVKGATAEFSGVAGTINLVLREPPRTLQRELRGNVNYRAVQPGGGLGGQWGDRIGGVSFVIPLNVARNAQGSQAWTERNSRTSAGVVQSQTIAAADEGRSGSVQLSPRLQWKLSDTESLSLSGFMQRVDSRNESDRQYASLLGTPWVTVADQSASQTQSLVQRLQGQWQRRFSEGGKLELKSSWQDTHRESQSHYTGWRTTQVLPLLRDTDVGFDESRATVGARLNLPVGEAHTLAVGLDGEKRERSELRRIWDAGVERIDSATGIPFQADTARVAFFMQDEWALGPQWAVLPGLRLEQVRTRSAESGRSIAIDNTARITAPTLHLNYRLDPKGRDQVRASVTRSFKLPDLSLLAARYVLNGNYDGDISNTPIAADRAGNPGLQPEIATGFDLSFEHYPAGGGVLSVGMFYRRIDDMIRQQITLEKDPAPGVASVPRWVSRPANVGRAFSQGLELEVKGRADEWLPVLFSRDSGVQLRAAWNFYRSKVELVEGPDNRLEAQPPWMANLGFDARINKTAWTVGASLILQPAYSTQQSDRQLSRRSGLRTFDAFVSWRMDRSTQLRLGVANLLEPDNESASTVEDLDGFFAGSNTRRNTLMAINASWVHRF